ncbi:sperm flagellar protein 1-like isoform X2 [Adelges cooleyi]|uniref:sperm flagellar protein 1-like isoform X2 n=1 Tax=Adelges cooleyi TaxID=133065 RepID=UPI00217FA2C4|nr:sperm flagellar protein 1-like isoform X2 [Adelges cooleyi]
MTSNSTVIESVTSDVESELCNLSLPLINNSPNSNKIDYSSVVQWINSFEFSRPKRNIARDFSDATMVAEIIKYYWPKTIELHNYIPASSLSNKISNWETLNRKVLKKLKLPLTKVTIKKLSMADMDAVCQFLKSLKCLVENDEHEKLIELEKSQTYPLYVIDNGEMVQVTENNTSRNKYLDQDVVRLINKLKLKIVDLEHKVDHLSTLIHVKDRRINDLQLQLNHTKKEKQ